MKPFSNKTKGGNSRSKNGAAILVRDMSSGPVLHFYQVSSKYSKGYSSYRVDKKFYTDADTDADANWILPQTVCPPSHPRFGGGGGGRRGEDIIYYHINSYPET